jgi:hypothetical protein
MEAMQLPMPINSQSSHPHLKLMRLIQMALAMSFMVHMQLHGYEAKMLLNRFFTRRQLLHHLSHCHRDLREFLLKQQ